MFGLVPFGKNRRGALNRGSDIWDLRDMGSDIWDIENAFNEFFDNLPMHKFFGGHHPIRADIRETDKEYVIEAEIPGVNKEDIKIDLRDDVLTIQVERNEQIDEERDNYIRKERRYGSYSRSFYVQDIDQDGVKAKYNNGILTITLPKLEEPGRNRRRIDIQ